MNQEITPTRSGHLDFASLYQERLHTMTLSGILLSHEKLFQMYQDISLRFYRGSEEAFALYTHYMYEKIFGEDFAAAIPPEQMEVMRQRFYDRYVGARHCLIRLTEAQDPFFAALDANLPGYRAIATPTLMIVAAELDGFIPLERTRTLAEGIRGARFVIIEGAGHAVVVEQAQRLAGLCLEFLNGLGS
jgi:pimeloyl-ACP methyl ester carboxylesterase